MRQALLTLASLIFLLSGCSESSQEVSEECSENPSLVDSQRFLTGMNYPWRIYGGDFGGIPAWSRTGIASNPKIYDGDLRAIHSTGSRIVRWWMFPDLRSGGIQIENGRLKAGKTLFADLREALRLAKKNDLRLVLCLFSFESFRPTTKEGSLTIRNLEGVLRDSQLRMDLMEEVIAPLARTAAQSPDSDALYAWDLMNEPEWSLKGVDPVGGHPFYPLESVRPVSHAFMQEFLAQLAQTIRKEGATRITVGQSTPRWPRTWEALDLDFYQWHLYDWMEERSIYLKPPPRLCKPVVFGELPLVGLQGESYTKMIHTMRANGWYGGWGWSYRGRVPAGAKLPVLVDTDRPGRL